jgi:hypothetical protein
MAIGRRTWHRNNLSSHPWFNRRFKRAETMPGFASVLTDESGNALYFELLPSPTTTTSSCSGPRMIGKLRAASC